MKKIKVKFTLGIGFPGADHEDIIDFEFEDNITDQEMEEELNLAWLERTSNYIDGNWEIMEDV